MTRGIGGEESEESEGRREVEREVCAAPCGLFCRLFRLSRGRCLVTYTTLTAIPETDTGLERRSEALIVICAARLLKWKERSPTREIGV